MKIEAIQIQNFGKFKNKRICFQDGINIVEGENGSGKTTVYTFLMKMLFGMERMRGKAAKTDDYSIYEPWEQKNIYEGKMYFSSGGKHFCLERSFYRKERIQRLYNIEDGEELSVEQGDLKMLLNDMDERFYKNTLSFSQEGARITGNFPEQLESYLAGERMGKESGIDIDHAIKTLKKRKREKEIELKNKNKDIEMEYYALHKQREIAETEWERQREAYRMQEEEAQQCFKAKKKSIYLHMILLGTMIFLTVVFNFVTAFGLYTPIYVTEMLFMAAFILECSRFYQFRLSSKKALEYYQENCRITEKKIRTVSAEMEKLTKPDEEELLLREDMEALQMALEHLEVSLGEQQREILVELNHNMSKILWELTEGQITEAWLNAQGKLSVKYQGKEVLPEFISRGCREQLYFAYRYALFELLNEEDMMLLLDDAFVYYDDKRMERILNWLSRQKRQVIIFTCQKREEESLKIQGITYHKVELARMAYE